MSKKIVTLYSDKEKTNELLPRTKTQAITNSSDVNLDTILSNKQDKVSSATDKVASFNSSGQVENSGITKSDVSQVVSEWKTIEEIKNNQEFNYREVPVSYDGTGTITSIKGNTVKFNQLISGARTWTNTIADTRAGLAFHIQFFDNNTFLTFLSFGTYRSPQYIKNIFTAPVNANRIKYKHNGQSSDIFFKDVNVDIYQGHKYYTCFNAKGVDTQTVGGMIIEDVQLFDLTAMGIDNLTTVEQVETWLSNNIGLLPYYAYTLGDLISFKSTGLKTVGFNQWDEDWEQGDISKTTGENTTIDHGIRSKGYIRVMPLTEYYIKYPTNVYNLKTRYYDGNKNYIGPVDANGHDTLLAPGIIKTPSGCCYFRFSTQPTYGDVYNNDICINISDQSKNGTYEPYKESTLSLEALNTLFPTGMKEAGSVYDELTESKATTRLNEVVLDGTFNWEVASNVGFVITSVNSGISDCKSDSNVNTECISNLFTRNTTTWRDGYFGIERKTIWVGDRDFARFGSLENFKTYLNNNPLTIYYELDTPTSQDISLDLTYPVYSNGTEQILPVNGSTPTTSNIICDIDYHNEAKVRQDNTDKIPDIVDDIDTINSNISNIVNTGDSDTPVENGTDKFTTGGAYDLKSLIDSKKDIYYGTTMPSSSMGNDGDVFILYS